MKVQYFGDEHDFRKYVLLRLLARHGFNIGVCWMLTPDDEGSDGGKRGYLKDEQASKWRHFNEELYDLLASQVSKSKLKERGLENPIKEDLKLIEDKGLIEGEKERAAGKRRVRYFEKEVPQSRECRTNYRAECCGELANANLIFYDPDNGLDVPSCPKGRKDSIKYVYCDELAEDYNKGKSLVVYQHFPRLPHPVVIKQKREQLGACLPSAKTWAFETTDVVFLLAAQPDHVKFMEAIEDDFQFLIEGGLYKAIHKPL